MASSASGQSMGVESLAPKGVATPFLPLQSTPQQRFKSLYSLVFTVAVAFHVLVAVALTKVSGIQLNLPAPQPIQVVSIAAPVSEAPRTVMPKPALIEPVAVQPVAPVIEIQSDTAITLAAVPTAAASVPASADAVKTVSYVEYVREPVAKYPPAARALKQKGVVTVRALIDVDGRAREVHVHKSCGYKLLDDAARSAVFAAQFKPYMENGRTRPVYVLIPIEFGAS